MATLNIFSSVESWETVLSLSAVLLVGLSVVVSLGALYAAKRVKKHDAERMVKLETDLSEAKKKQAEAELELERIKRPRILDHKRLVEELKGKPTARVEILYQPDDPEAFAFARQIDMWLGGKDEGRVSAAGWEITSLRPLTPEDAIGGFGGFNDAPLIMRAGGGWGVNIVHGWLSDDVRAAVSALIWAFDKAGVPRWIVTGPTNKLPKDLVRIIVGPKI